MNALEVQMLGLSRSGNHAIADWIFAQAPPPRLFLNCAEGGTDPFASCRPLATGKGWRGEPDDTVAADRMRHAHRSLLIHSYEDSPIDYVLSERLRQCHDAWLGPSRRSVFLLVLRDPFNLFASRRRMGRNLPTDFARNLWKSHARAALDPAQLLPAGSLVVLYNRWSADRAYRRHIADALGLEFCDRAADQVPSCAGGSSFDGTEFDGNAAAMATQDRWRHFANEEEFTTFFDEEMVELSERLFDLETPRAMLAAS